MAFDRVELMIADPHECPSVLDITSTGSVAFTLGTNRHAVDRPEIGTYSTNLADRQLVALRRALSHPRLETVLDHAGLLIPDEPYRRLRVLRDGVATDKYIGFRYPTVPAMSAILGELANAVQFVEASPRRALRLKITATHLDTKGDGATSASIYSVGTETARVWNPFFIGARHALVDGMLWPRVVDWQARHLEAGRASTFVSISARERARVPALNEEILSLEPGETLTFEVQVGFGDVPPGLSTIRFAYIFGESKIVEEEPVAGEVFTVDTCIVLPTE